MTIIEKALQRTTDTKALFLGPGVIVKTAQMFRELFPGKKGVVVADTNTFRVAGEQVDSILEESGLKAAEPFIFDDPDLFAEWGFACRLKEYLSGIDAIAVAVGSGVINDLTKYVSYTLGRRYMIVGTAASMDGYTAYGASISIDGNKQTLDCPAPKGMILDPVISARAPKELAASGYADLIAKIPAGADWMIAESIGVEPIDPFTWDLVQRNLRNALSAPDKVKAGDVQATEALAEGETIMESVALRYDFLKEGAGEGWLTWSNDLISVGYPDNFSLMDTGSGVLFSDPKVQNNAYAVTIYSLDFDYDDVYAPQFASMVLPKSTGLAADPEIETIDGRVFGVIKGEVSGASLALYLTGKGRTVVGVMFIGNEVVAIAEDVLKSLTIN